MISTISLVLSGIGLSLIGSLCMLMLVEIRIKKEMKLMGEAIINTQKTMMKIRAEMISKYLFKTAVIQSEVKEDINSFKNAQNGLQNEIKEIDLRLYANEQ